MRLNLTPERAAAVRRRAFGEYIRRYVDGPAYERPAALRQYENALAWIDRNRADGNPNETESAA